MIDLIFISWICSRIIVKVGTKNHCGVLIEQNCSGLWKMNLDRFEKEKVNVEYDHKPVSNPV